MVLAFKLSVWVVLVGENFILNADVLFVYGISSADLSQIWGDVGWELSSGGK